MIVLEENSIHSVVIKDEDTIPNKDEKVTENGGKKRCESEIYFYYLYQWQCLEAIKDKKISKEILYIRYSRANMKANQLYRNCIRGEDY